MKTGIVATANVWTGALRILQSEVTPITHETWLRPLRAVEGGAEKAEDELHLSCPSPFHHLRVREKFLDRIEHAASQFAGRPITVKLTVDESPTLPAPSPSSSPMRATVRVAGTSNVSPEKLHKAGPRTATATQHEFPYCFDSFVTGSCNALAREASYALATGAQCTISPLFLAASPGLGKTHLARAVVRQAKKSGADKVLYTSAERFTGNFLNSVRNGGMEQFKQHYRKECKLLIVENVEFFSGKKQTQLEFFHTIEHLRDSGARVMFTAGQLPHDILKLDPRLTSHMRAGLVAEIEPPDAIVRRAILRDRAARGGVHLPEECLEMLVDNLRGSVRDLEGVLTQLVSSSALLHRKIDIELTEMAMRKVGPSQIPDTVLDLHTIVDIVARFFKTTPTALASRSRRREVVLPRQLAMYLCHRYTDASLKEIGRAFNKNHPSVSNAIKVIERNVLERAPLRYQFEAITKRIEIVKRERISQRPN